MSIAQRDRNGLNIPHGVLGVERVSVSHLNNGRIDEFEAFLRDVDLSATNVDAEAYDAMMRRRQLSYNAQSGAASAAAL